MAERKRRLRPPPRPHLFLPVTLANHRADAAAVA